MTDDEMKSVVIKWLAQAFEGESGEYARLVVHIDGKIAVLKAIREASAAMAGISEARGHG